MHAVVAVTVAVAVAVAVAVTLPIVLAFAVAYAYVMAVAVAAVDVSVSVDGLVAVVSAVPLAAVGAVIPMDVDVVLGREFRRSNFRGTAIARGKDRSRQQ